jgi:cyclase
MQQLSENVYSETKTRGCNPSYVLTSGGAVVIDTPQLPTQAVSLREQIEEKAPIAYLFNTEHHIDHIFGNYYFGGAGIVVSHVEVRNNFMTVAENGFDPYEYAKEAIPTDDPGGAAIFPDRDVYYANLNQPTVTFDRNLTIHVGDHTFELMHTPGHTPGQICIYVPEERTVFTGDTIFNQCQTWLHESDIRSWLLALDMLAELDVDTIIPGHGPVCTKNEINAQRALLHEWMSIIAGGIARGLSKEECLASVDIIKNRMPVDIGQEYMLDTVIQNNSNALYDQLVRGCR